MSHLFISHSTRYGAAIAQQLCAALEQAGHRCWIAPSDVKPGVPYPGQIVAAIRDCAGLVLVVTPAANESPDVLQEVQLAGQHRKTVAPVVADRTTPSDDLHYYLGVRHQIAWTDAAATTKELLRSFPPGQVQPRIDADTHTFANALANIPMYKGRSMCRRIRSSRSLRTGRKCISSPMWCSSRRRRGRGRFCSSR